MDEMHCCAVLGHSPMRFHWGFDEEDYKCKKLKIVLLQQIIALRISGVSQFMVACDPGVGLWCGEIINCLRNGDDELQLYCVLPHEGQSTKWAPYLRERYFEMLEKCTYMSAICTHKTPTAQMDAYKNIIKQSDVVLAVYDPASNRGDDVDRAIAYAATEQKPIILVHPDTFSVTVSKAGK